MRRKTRPADEDERTPISVDDIEKAVRGIEGATSSLLDAAGCLPKIADDGYRNLSLAEQLYARKSVLREGLAVQTERLPSLRKALDRATGQARKRLSELRSGRDRLQSQGPQADMGDAEEETAGELTRAERLQARLRKAWRAAADAIRRADAKTYPGKPEKGLKGRGESHLALNPGGDYPYKEDDAAGGGQGGSDSPPFSESKAASHAPPAMPPEARRRETEDMRKTGSSGLRHETPAAPNARSERL